MAREYVCGVLSQGQDADCIDISRGYYQQLVLINLSDIDRSTEVISLPNPETGECAYNVQFSLKPDKTGIFFTGPQGGTSIFGTYDKSRSDIGLVQYIHRVSMLIVGSDEVSKCIQDALNTGRYAIALQHTNGTVEIYGYKNGMSTEDYTFDVQAGGGGSILTLASPETSPEPRIPFVYKSLIPGEEDADFNSAFANTGT